MLKRSSLDELRDLSKYVSIYLPAQLFILYSRAPPLSFVWGNGFMGTQTRLSSKFIFSSDFGLFILKMLEYSKKLHVSRKKLLKYHNFWGDVPADFSTAGDASPHPPAFATHEFIPSDLSTVPYTLSTFLPDRAAADWADGRM